jgi:hypothetical protein
LETLTNSATRVTYETLQKADKVHVSRTPDERRL